MPPKKRSYNELVILVIKIPTLYDTSTTADFRKSLGSLFTGLVGYDVKIIFLPTAESETSISCVYPGEPIKDGSALMEKLEELIEAVEAPLSLPGGFPIRPRRTGKMNIWFE